jgi:hypothetical protein
MVAQAREGLAERAGRAGDQQRVPAEVVRLAGLAPM